MNWLNEQSIKWIDPLAFTERFAGADIALLYSGMREAASGDFSYLCVHPIASAEGGNWGALPLFSADPAAGHLPDWVGYLGYEMSGDAAAELPAFLHLPQVRLVRYGRIYRFDHARETVEVFSREGADVPPVAALGGIAPVIAEKLRSNFTRAGYEDTVKATIERIHAGDFYQANITRKFLGEFAQAPDSWKIFRTLCAASPAPYSAFIRHGGSAILSASPECFLRMDAAGNITTRPPTR